jgi:hypothetical protein
MYKNMPTLIIIGQIIVHTHIETAAATTTTTTTTSNRPNNNN